MQVSTTSLALAAAVVGAASFAFFHDDRATAARITVPAPQAQGPETPLDDEGDPPLPANHPPMGGEAQGAASAGVAPSDATAALTWKAPASWPSQPNPSSFRIATHKVPHAKGDTEDAELSVVRAGGDVDANIQRWVEQFEGATSPKRQEKTVHGVKVTVVEVEGTYQGGMGAAPTPHAGWALLAAIVATPDEPYFFKVTGPTATVRAARPTFDALLESIEPVAR